MTGAIVSLALAYACLLFLLLLAVLRSQVRVPVKFGLLALGCGFYVWHYLALQSFVGWPAEQRLPPRFQLLSTYIVEPVQKDDEPGSIFLWLRDLDSEDPTPRSFRLAYDRLLHSQIEDAGERQQQGERLVAEPRYTAPGSAPASIEFDSLPRESRDRKTPIAN